MILNNLSGGGGSFDHRELQHTDAADQHTIGSITGLREELDDIESMPVMQQVTLSSAGWTKPAGSTRYQQQVSVTGVTATTPVVFVDVDLTGEDLEADAEAVEIWRLISANNVLQGNGVLTFYTYVAPTTTIKANVALVWSLARGV